MNEREIEFNTMETIGNRKKSADNGNGGKKKKFIVDEGDSSNMGKRPITFIKVS
jgi:hypothetical protein